MPRLAARTRILRLATIAVGALLVGVGCKDPPPGGVLRLDVATLRDIGQSVDGAVIPPRGDAGPRLPPADRDVVLPRGGPIVSLPFTLRADPAKLDLHLSVDTTGSFDGEIDAIQRDLDTLVLPGVRARVADVAVGVSRFEDFPRSPFGASGDTPFQLLAPVTTNEGVIREAVNSLDQPLGNGADGPESGFEALYQIATGSGLVSGAVPFIAPYTGEGTGGVGFRDGALHTIVHITDAPSHVTEDYMGVIEGTHSAADATAALSTLPAYVLAAVGRAEARADLVPIALATGATMAPTGGRCPTGLNGALLDAIEGRCPLVFDIAQDGSGLSETIVTAISGLVETLRYGRVSAEFDGDPFGFILAFEAVGATPPAGVATPTIVDEAPEDGVPDTFLGVRSGTELEFELRLRNDILASQDYDQVFRITVRVIGDGVTLIEETIRVTVPAAEPPPPDPDAGMQDAGITDAGGMDGGPTSDGGTN